MKRRILVTGATGNVGNAVLRSLPTDVVAVTAAVRDPSRAAELLPAGRAALLEFDFERGTGFDALDDFDAVFLVRPPQLADAERYFRPFLERATQCHIVFLSVQGADHKSFLPHAKIERLILEHGISHTFLRAGYFMENLLTTLRTELQKNNRIFLPAASLRFNWVAVQDIADCAVEALLAEAGTHQRTGWTSGAIRRQDGGTGRLVCSEHADITGAEALGFAEVLRIVNECCSTNFHYESPSLLRYIFAMRDQPFTFTFVMLLLHFFPRFQRRSALSNSVTDILRREPTTLRAFAVRHCDTLRTGIGSAS